LVSGHKIYTKKITINSKTPVYSKKTVKHRNGNQCLVYALVESTTANTLSDAKAINAKGDAGRVTF
jgi:hypothetical protein